MSRNYIVFDDFECMYGYLSLYGCFPLIAAINYPCMLPYQWLKYTSIIVDSVSINVYMYNNFHEWINIDDLTCTCMYTETSGDQGGSGRKYSCEYSGQANILIVIALSVFILYTIWCTVCRWYVCMYHGTTCIHFAVFICTCVYA